MYTNSSNQDTAIINNLHLAQNQVNSILEESTNFPGFRKILRHSFGSSYDSHLARTLTHQWKSSDFSAIPEINLLNPSRFKGANGAFASSTQMIYLAKDLLKEVNKSNDVSGVVGVLLEEVGHFIDDLINPVDTPGDEGELFAAIIQGVDLSNQELNTLSVEDDHASLTINSQSIDVEQSSNSDFDGDGISDILWRNSKNGATHIWKINGDTMTRQKSAVLDVVTEDSGWKATGIGDFDGDGVSDILWRNSKNGATHIWKINGDTMTRQKSAVLDVVTGDSGWKVFSTRDFDADGVSDILWRNSKNGATHIWKINGDTMTRQRSVVLDVVTGDSGWKVIPDLNPGISLGGPVNPSYQYNASDYLKSLYRDNLSNTMGRTDHEGTSAFDSSDNDSDPKVYALVGGIVIEARNGEEIIGRNPVFSDWVKNGTVAIYNQNLNKTFIYWHLAAGSIDQSLKGKTIAPGTSIGQEGNTGYSFGVHTHVEVHEGRVTIDMARGVAPANTGRLNLALVFQDAVRRGFVRPFQ